VLSIVVAIPAGLVSAARRNSLADNLAMTLALIGQSAPTFYIGIMLILVLGLQLRWFPISGRGQGSWLDPADWGDMLYHVILPAPWSPRRSSRGRASGGWRSSRS